MLRNAIGVKIVFKMSALCGEYISECAYKYVDVNVTGLFVLPSQSIQLALEWYRIHPNQEKDKDTARD